MPTEEEISDYLLSSRKEYDEETKIKKEKLDEKRREQKNLMREIRSHKTGRKIPLVTYSEMYETLDLNIEDIEERLATCEALEDIALIYNCRYVTFRNWLRESKQYERIRLAVEFSAEFHVSMGFKLIRKAIEDPDLTMQQAALLRAELYNHNAAAAVRQPKVFGKKAEEGLSAATVIIASDDQIGNMIEKFRQLAAEKRMLESGEYEESDENEDEEDGEYEDELSDVVEEREELDNEEDFQEAEEIK